MAALHELATALNSTADPAEQAALKAGMLAAGALLGLVQGDPEAWFQKSGDEEGPSAEEIEALIEARKAARTARDFAEADRIRDDLKDRGVQLEDGAGGTTWKRAR